MASRAYRSAGLTRSLTLLWTFLVASAAMLAVGAVLLSSVLSRSVEKQVLEDSARYAAVYANTALTPALVRGERVVVSVPELRRLRSATRTRGDLTGISVWSPEGRLLAATYPRHPSAIADPAVSAVLRSRKPMAKVARIPLDPGGSEEGLRQIVAWSPLRTTAGRVVGVAEVDMAPTILDERVATASRTIWVAVAIVFVLLWLALALLVRGAAARLARQNDAFQDRSRELLETTQRLEESLLETVETLNAAVEARDPYTAGHSQRVRRVALAIGRNLGLNAKQLGVLSTAALFHDVGKIGIPDSILTKAGPLEPSEAAVMREHVLRGAEIAAKVSSFQDAIPAIRHHHERWDGLGYPDGLSGEDIPLEATIVGLADAWDAMTTNRPYATALSLNEALMQIRSGRGKQFSPAVVDAFAEVARRQPAEVLPPETGTATLGVA
jgi:putative nucleotidyltransferase with HDIG domain